MPTIRQIARQQGITKMGAYNRVRSIIRADPSFAKKYTKIDVNRNNMLIISDEGADIIENYAKRHRNHKKFGTKPNSNKENNDTNSNTSSDTAKVTVLKIQINSLKTLINSKDSNIYDKDQDIRDKKEELRRVHQDLAKSQQLLQREQELDNARVHRYEQRINYLNNKIKKLPGPKNVNTYKNKHHKRPSFWQRIFGK